MTTYDVIVFREDELWVADIVDLGVTDMLHFSEREEQVRDYVSGMTDVEPDSFDLRWRYRAGQDEVTEAINELCLVEAALADFTARHDALRRQIIAQMSAAGLSQRAIGDVLGLSHQRVNQLAKAS
jgi:predicted XRE-type DNA-binding protein